MAGALDTFTKFINLRDTTNLTNTRFAVLCTMYGIQGMSDASLNRALQRKSFSNDVDAAVRPLILRLEDMCQRFYPLKPSFEDLEATKLLLDLMVGLSNDGHELVLQVVSNKSGSDTTPVGSNPIKGLLRFRRAVKHERWGRTYFDG